MRLEVRRLGRVEYEDGLALQEALAGAVGDGAVPDTLLLLEHEPVLTLGRGATAENIVVPPDELARRGITVFETGRGGDVTYHGPGQVVGYPIVNLGREKETKDVRKFVRALEEVMIRTCAGYGITAARDEKNPGVWVGREKIGAIGVRIAKWVTSHGFAFNVSTDLSAFDLIVPCGIADRGVTSLSKLLGREVPIPEVEDRLERHAAEVLVRDPVRRDVDQTTIAVVIRRRNHFLVLRRVPAGGGFWQIVTGRMEAGESPAQAAARELREETGFTAPIAPLGYEHAFALAPDGNARSGPRLGREIVFVADVASEAAISDEHDAHEWLPAHDAAARMRHPGHRCAIARAAEQSVVS